VIVGKTKTNKPTEKKKEKEKKEVSQLNSKPKDRRMEGGERRRRGDPYLCHTGYWQGNFRSSWPSQSHRSSLHQVISQMSIGDSRANEIFEEGKGRGGGEGWIKEILELWLTRDKGDGWVDGLIP